LPNEGARFGGLFFYESRMMKPIRSILAAGCNLLLLCGALDAAVVAKKGNVSVTTEDFYTYHFISSPSKIEALRGVDRELDSTFTEILSARQFNADSANQPALSAEEASYLAMQKERAPLIAHLNIAERRARAKFSVNDPLVVSRARELWIADEKAFMTDESADITQIFFDLAARPYAETHKRILTAQEELKAGKPFEEVLARYSDDKALAKTQGKIAGIQLSRADPLMGRVIFKQLNVGEVSDVTPSRIGLHIVRLDRKKPATKKKFDEVKGPIFEQLLEEVAKNARLDLLSAIHKMPTEYDEAALDAFRIKPDPALEEQRRKKYQELGIPLSPKLPQ
jgi:parvulin-like peptidyl-prolyl isomerase